MCDLWDVPVVADDAMVLVECGLKRELELCTSVHSENSASDTSVTLYLHGHVKK